MSTTIGFNAGWSFQSIPRQLANWGSSSHFRTCEGWNFKIVLTNHFLMLPVVSIPILHILPEHMFENHLLNILVLHLPTLVSYSFTSPHDIPCLWTKRGFFLRKISLGHLVVYLYGHRAGVLTKASGSDDVAMDILSAKVGGLPPMEAHWNHQKTGSIFTTPGKITAFWTWHDNWALKCFRHVMSLHTLEF